MKVWQLYGDVCTKELQVHYSIQHGKHVGKLLWVYTAYHVMDMLRISKFGRS